MNDVLNELLAMRKEIHAQNVAKGFWAKGKDENKGERAMLIITELAEAVEADREGRWFDGKGAYPKGHELYGQEGGWFFKDHIKDSVQDELADTVIRTLDYIEGFDLPLLINENETYEFQGDNFAENVYILVDNIATKSIGEHLKLILAFCDHYKIDILQHVKWKLRYNTTRPAKHGKAY